MHEFGRGGIFLIWHMEIVRIPFVVKNYCCCKVTHGLRDDSPFIETRGSSNGET